MEKSSFNHNNNNEDSVTMVDYLQVMVQQESAAQTLLNKSIIQFLN